MEALLVRWGFTGDDETHVQTYSMVLWKTIVQISMRNAAVANLKMESKQLYWKGKSGRSSAVIISFLESGQAQKMLFCFSNLGSQKKRKAREFARLSSAHSVGSEN